MGILTEENYEQLADFFNTCPDGELSHSLATAFAQEIGVAEKRALLKTAVKFQRLLPSEDIRMAVLRAHAALESAG